MRERKIYECEHCNKKKLISKTQMLNHELICWYNPKNKTCVTCFHRPKYTNECYLEIERKDKPNINCEHWKSFDDGLYEEEEIK